MKEYLKDVPIIRKLEIGNQSDSMAVPGRGVPNKRRRTGSWDFNGPERNSLAQNILKDKSHEDQPIFNR